jgi:hypothetical protein
MAGDALDLDVDRCGSLARAHHAARHREGMPVGSCFARLVLRCRSHVIVNSPPIEALPHHLREQHITAETAAHAHAANAVNIQIALPQAFLASENEVDIVPMVAHSRCLGTELNGICKLDHIWCSHECGVQHKAQGNQVAGPP